MIIGSMSDGDGKVHAMEAIASGDEAEARLCGLMATLTLPLVREGKVDVEVRVTRTDWEPIDSVSIEADRVTFSYGINGKANTWVFLRSEGIPPWRTRVRRERVGVSP